MKLSSRGHYGLMAMTYLAQKADEGPTPIKQIASAEQIPEQYLEQIFAELRKAGLVSSVRGARGGYRLARSPEEINVGQVVKVLEGEIAPVECLHSSEEDTELCCSKTDNCTTKVVWEKLRDTMVAVLDDITLHDIVTGSAKLYTQKQSAE
ncbi:AsnC family transcriptional regulator [Tumebacillus algifaecis]|uniref:AsnC family transcriptional regulator n=1 Tax=Tumebacillus algifaecis TaxID=1214604 RepID=A0A223CZQ0_9BACL|nr:AsnC family transcriptional regulator [Tumebacillus algifaecis]